MRIAPLSSSQAPTLRRRSAKPPPPLLSERRGGRAPPPEVNGAHKGPLYTRTPHVPRDNLGRGASREQGEAPRVDPRLRLRAGDRRRVPQARRRGQDPGLPARQSTPPAPRGPTRLRRRPRPGAPRLAPRLL